MGVLMLGVAGVVLSCLLQVTVGGGPVYCQPGQVQTLAAGDVASKRASLGGSCTPMTSAVAVVRCCADYR